MGRGKSKFGGKSHEKRERTICDCGQEERGELDAGGVDGRWRSDGRGGTKFSGQERAGKAGGNGAEQVLLPYQGTDSRGAGAAQTIGVEADGGEEGDRGDADGI